MGPRRVLSLQIIFRFVYTKLSVLPLGSRLNSAGNTCLISASLTRAHTCVYDLSHNLNCAPPPGAFTMRTRALPISANSIGSGTACRIRYEFFMGLSIRARHYIAYKSGASSSFPIRRYGRRASRILFAKICTARNPERGWGLRTIFGARLALRMCTITRLRQLNWVASGPMRRSVTDNNL